MGGVDVMFVALWPGVGTAGGLMAGVAGLGLGVPGGLVGDVVPLVVGDAVVCVAVDVADVGELGWPAVVCANALSENAAPHASASNLAF